MYLIILNGKGTGYYNIGSFETLDITDYFKDAPFKVRIVEVLETDRACSIRNLLHLYFADYRTNDDWFSLQSKQVEKLKSLMADSDSLISDVSDGKEKRFISLPPRRWEKLTWLAEQTNSLGEAGAMLGQVSVSVLLDRIASDPKLLRLIEKHLNGDKKSTAPVGETYQTPVIVRPAEAKTETIAWLEVEGDEIRVRFPEKRDDYNELVKALNLRWDSETGCHTRKINHRAGDPHDRLAELGQELLANGFSVIFPDEQIQEMAISGAYEPECKRWILVRKSGPYAGWFVLSWAYSEDCYDAAKRISGSRYDKPQVVAPPEQFAEVIDFARIHRFRFSQAALALVVEAKAMKESALTVSIEQLNKPDYDLNLPDLEWEDDDLADNLEFDASPVTPD